MSHEAREPRSTVEPHAIATHTPAGRYLVLSHTLRVPTVDNGDVTIGARATSVGWNVPVEMAVCVKSGSPPLTTVSNWQRPDRALGTCTRRPRGGRWAWRGPLRAGRSYAAGRAQPVTQVGRSHSVGHTNAITNPKLPQRAREIAKGTMTRRERNATRPRLHLRRALRRGLLDARADLLEARRQQRAAAVARERLGRGTYR